MHNYEVEVLSVNDLLVKEFPRTDSLLGGNLIDKSGAVLISGPQKIGKSLFATQLALSLADRQAFLDMPVGNAEYRVLILQAEVSPKRMQERLARQVAGFSAEAQARVLNASVFSAVKLDTVDGASTVMAWVEKYGPDLLIIDPLASFHTGDENEAQDMSRVTSLLDQIRSHGVAVALVHHHGKSSSERANVGYKARGSSVLSGWYDSHFSLEWAEPGRTVRLRFELRHDETPGDLILRLNRNRLLFETQADEAAQISLVTSVIRDSGSADAEAVAERCHKSRQWASDWLNRAVDQNRLTRTNGRPVIFSVPGQPPETTVSVTAQGVVVSTNTTEPPPVWIDGQEIAVPFRQ